MSWQRWFAEIWLDDRARKVLGEYQQIGRQYPLFLADLMTRGGVFSEPAAKASSYEAGYDAGRRALALETLSLAQADPRALERFIPRNPAEGAQTQQQRRTA
jgi:hypothetical protein